MLYIALSACLFTCLPACMPDCLAGSMNTFLHQLATSLLFPLNVARLAPGLYMAAFCDQRRVGRDEDECQRQTTTGDGVACLAMRRPTENEGRRGGHREKERRGNNRVNDNTHTMERREEERTGSVEVRQRERGRQRRFDGLC